MPEMTAERMRSYAATIAEMDDLGAKRKAAILDGLGVGLTLEEIAEHLNEPLVDVLTPLSRNPVALALNIIDGESGEG